MFRRFCQRLLLPANHSEMKMCRRKLWVQMESLRKFHRGLFILWNTCQQGSEIIVQVSPLGSEFDGTVHFLDGIFDWGVETERPCKLMMSFGVARSKAHQFLERGARGGEVLLLESGKALAIEDVCLSLGMRCRGRPLRRR